MVSRAHYCNFIKITVRGIKGTKIMTKKPINITIKQDTRVARIFQAAIKEKDDFRKAVEQITIARNIKTAKPQRVQPV